MSLFRALRLGDLQPGDGRLQITAGKGGHQRIVPIADRFFVTLASYLDAERAQMRCSDDRVYVVRKGRPPAGGCRRPGSTRFSRGPGPAPG